MESAVCFPGEARGCGEVVDPEGGAVRRCLWEGGRDPWKPFLGFHGEGRAFHGQSNKLSMAEQGGTAVVTSTVVPRRRWLCLLSVNWVFYFGPSWALSW